MWRDRPEYRKAVALMDELRPHRYRRHRIEALIRQHKGTGWEYILVPLAVTRSPASKKVILDHLLRLATKRKRTFASLFGRACEDQQPNKSQQLKTRGADLERILTEAIEGWGGPDT
jgi:hypothetical protein